MVYSKVGGRGGMCCLARQKTLHNSQVGGNLSTTWRSGPLLQAQNIQVEFFQFISSVIPIPNLRILLHPNQSSDLGIADVPGSSSILFGALGPGLLPSAMRGESLCIYCL